MVEAKKLDAATAERVKNEPVQLQKQQVVLAGIL